MLTVNSNKFSKRGIHGCLFLNSVVVVINEFWFCHLQVKIRLWQDQWISGESRPRLTTSCQEYIHCDKRVSTEVGYMTASDIETKLLSGPNIRACRTVQRTRDGYRENKSLSYQCEKCPTRHLCTKSRNCQKMLTYHIWFSIPRKEKIARTFADVKRFFFYQILP